MSVGLMRSICNKQEWRVFSLICFTYMIWLARNMFLAMYYKINFSCLMCFRSYFSTFYCFLIEINFIDYILKRLSLMSFFSIDRYKANVFSSKRERTYDMLLQDIYEKYIVDEHSLENHSNTFAGSTSINKLYGNNRKLKDQKVSLKTFF